jgi:predicted esterase
MDVAVKKVPSKAILCLHGGGASPEIFRFQLATFRAQLKDEYEFIYATGPHRAVPGPDVLPFFAGMPAYYSWFRKEYTSIDEEIEMFNTSIQRSVQDWEQTNPHSKIVGVLGFSQGGLASTVLLWEQEMGRLPWLPKLRFGVLICCAYSDVATDYMRANSNLTDGITKITTPSLHFHGSQDCNLGQAKNTLAVHYLTSSTKVVNFEGGHHIPKNVKDVRELVHQIAHLS